MDRNQPPESAGEQARHGAPDVPDRAPDIQMGLFAGRGGKLTASYIGPAPKGEQWTAAAALAVVARLRELGQVWTDPVRPPGPENGVDAVSTGPAGQLQMQVVNLPVDGPRWQSIHRDGSISGVSDTASAAEDLFAAVRKKGDKYGVKTCRDLTLILNASTSMIYSVQQTIDAYIERYGAEGARYGFAAIWVVTPLGGAVHISPIEGG